MKNTSKRRKIYREEENERYTSRQRPICTFFFTSEVSVALLFPASEQHLGYIKVDFGVQGIYMVASGVLGLEEDIFSAEDS